MKFWRLRCGDFGFTEGENLVLEHRPADQGMAEAGS